MPNAGDSFAIQANNRGAPASAYAIPDWYTQSYNTKLQASNAANDAWFANPVLDKVSFSGRPTYHFEATPAPAFALYGDDVARGYQHGAAALQGLFDARMKGEPGYYNQGGAAWGDWTGWGPDGEGFTRVPGAPTPAASLFLGENISPALYERSMLSPSFTGGSGMLGTWDAPLGMPEWTPGGSPVNIGGIQYRPGSDGDWRSNIFNHAIDAVFDALGGTYESAQNEVRQALGRKGQLGTMMEKFAMNALRGDADAYNLNRYGDDAVRHFDNLVSQDLSWLDNELNSVWGSVGAGSSVPWFREPKLTYAGQNANLGPFAGIAAVAAPENLRLSGGYNSNWWQPVIDRATENYEQGMEYAGNLAPNLENVFGLAMQAANKGAGDVRAFAGVGQPTAYFGDLQRAGGWQEQIPDQEFANQFSEENQRSYGGATS